MGRKDGANPNVSTQEDLGAIMDAEARLARMLAQVEEESRAREAAAVARTREMEREGKQRLAARLAQAEREESAFRSAELKRIAENLAAASAKWRQAGATEMASLVDLVLARLVSAEQEGPR